MRPEISSNREQRNQMLPDLDPRHINHGSDQGRVEYQLQTNYHTNEASLKSVNPTVFWLDFFLFFCLTRTHLIVCPLVMCDCLSVVQQNMSGTRRIVLLLLTKALFKFGCFKGFCKKPNSLFYWVRPVVPGCAGCATAHPDFVRSVNPISTRGDKLCPPNYYWHTRIFSPSNGPVSYPDSFYVPLVSLLYFLIV